MTVAYTARFLTSLTIPRSLKATAIVIGSLVAAGGMVRPTQDAVANGDTRTLTMRHLHTGETVSITYKRNGVYDQSALKQINWFMRDWRRNESTRMDPRVLDTVWMVYRSVGARQPIQIVCGYRAPGTNAMLRRRSRGVARFSQHTLGKAIDYFIPGVPLAKLRVAGLRLQRGGVGYYPTSGSPFVHMDAGNVRMWPRMSRSQLAQVFPDGKTVHIPADGRPMPGYAAARVALAAGGSRIGSFSGGGDDEAEESGGGLFSFLGGGGGRNYGTRKESQFAVMMNQGRSATQNPRIAPAPVPGGAVVADQQEMAPEPTATRAVPVPLPEPRPSELDAREPAMVAQADVPLPVAPPPELANRQVAEAVPEMPPARAVPAQPTPVAMAYAAPAPVETPARPNVGQWVVGPAGQPLSADTDIDAWVKAPTGQARPARQNVGQWVAGPAGRAAAPTRAIAPRAPTVRPQQPVLASAGPLTPLARPTRQALATDDGNDAASAQPVRRGGAGLAVRKPTLVATRFDRLDFRLASTPVTAARDVKLASLTKPDLRAGTGLLPSPNSVVDMRFGLTAYKGLSVNRFSGPAVKALRTARFSAGPDIITGSLETRD